MAFQSAGAARFQHRATASRRRLLKIIAVVIVLVMVAVVVRAPLVRKFGTKKAPLVTPTQPTLGTQQAADVNLVAGAVGQYAAANAALPTRLSVTAGGDLVLCGSICDSTNYEVGGFTTYEAANIKLVTYASNLVVPDQQTMYLVPSAKCGHGGGIGAINMTPRSMVILYDAVVDSRLTPRCVVL